MARFPGPVVLRPSNWRWLLVGFIVVAGLGPAIYFAATKPDTLQPALLVLAIVPVILSSLLSPQASSLTLRADGFELQFLFFGRKRLPWREASEFAAVKSNRRNSLLSTTRRSLAARSQSSTSRDLGAPQTCPTPTGSRPKASPNSCRSGANARSISARPAPAYCRSTDIPGHRGVEFRPERSGPRRARQQSRQCGPLVCAARALL